MEKEGLIEINNIEKSFGSNHVIRKLSLSIKKPGIFGIMGLSGCGKTTLLNILIGYWKADSGSITYDGLEIIKHKYLFNEIFGFGTQAGSVYPKLTVSENLKYFGKMYNMRKVDIEKRIPEVEKLVELIDCRNTLAEELSTGMYRRLDIACAMMHNPRVLILDEPTGNLDPVLRKKILALIKRIDDQGTKVILTSHLMGEAEQICDELAIIHKGQVVALDHPDELKAKYSKKQEIKFQTKSQKYDKLKPQLKKIGATKIFEKGNYIYLYTSDGEKLIMDLIILLKRNDQTLVNIEVSKPKIEEVFEALTKK